MLRPVLLLLSGISVFCVGVQGLSKAGTAESPAARLLDATVLAQKIAGDCEMKECAAKQCADTFGTCIVSSSSCVKQGNDCVFSQNETSSACTANTNQKRECVSVCNGDPCRVQYFAEPVDGTCGGVMFCLMGRTVRCGDQKCSCQSMACL